MKEKVRNIFVIRDLREKEKFFADDAYINGYAKHLGVAATAVYMSLCRHASNKQECWPSQHLIAAEHSIDARTVRRAIQKLKNMNIIKTAREKTKKGKWLNNIYILTDKSQWLKPIGHECPMDVHRTNETKTRGHQTPMKDKDISTKDITSSSYSSTSRSEEEEKQVYEKPETVKPEYEPMLPAPLHTLTKAQIAEATKLCEQQGLDLKEQCIAIAIEGGKIKKPYQYLMTVLRRGGVVGAAEIAEEAAAKINRAKQQIWEQSQKDIEAAREAAELDRLWAAMPPEEQSKIADEALKGLPPFVVRDGPAAKARINETMKRRRCKNANTNN